MSIFIGIFGNGDFPVTFVDDMWDGTVRDALLEQP
jgi:hypothetical protein